MVCPATPGFALSAARSSPSGQGCVFFGAAGVDGVAPAVAVAVLATAWVHFSYAATSEGSMESTAPAAARLSRSTSSVARPAMPFITRVTPSTSPITRWASSSCGFSVALDSVSSRKSSEIGSPPPSSARSETTGIGVRRTSMTSRTGARYGSTTWNGVAIAATTSPTSSLTSL